MIYDYVNTKPPLNEETLAEYGIIEHGWLKDQAAKFHKYISRKKNDLGKWIYTYKQDKAARDKRKARKQWMEKGVKEAYNQRKSQIGQARVNADRAYRSDPKMQYKVRKKKVSQARQNAHDAYISKIRTASDAAFNSYYDRKDQASNARNTAKNKHKRAETMSNVYNRRPGLGRKSTTGGHAQQQNNKSYRKRK